MDRETRMFTQACPRHINRHSEEERGEQKGAAGERECCGEKSTRTQTYYYSILLTSSTAKMLTWLALALAKMLKLKLTWHPLKNPRRAPGCSSSEWSVTLLSFKSQRTDGRMTRHWRWMHEIGPVCLEKPGSLAAPGSCRCLGLAGWRKMEGVHPSILLFLSSLLSQYRRILG